MPALRGVDGALVEPAPDLDPADAKVDVSPAQGDQLADAQPGLGKELN